jgi:hypothetical protein
MPVRQFLAFSLGGMIGEQQSLPPPQSQLQQHIKNGKFNYNNYYLNVKFIKSIDLFRLL